MTPEQQRVAIAEACGWTNVAPRIVKNVKHQGDNILVGTWSDNGWIPDYLNDLNAMHDAEQMLWRVDWSHRYVFNDHLANTIKGRPVNRNEWDAETLLDATAAQRAEAFLRTIGKWKECK
jgi:hypothetical protein